MAAVNVRGLARNTSKVIDDVERRKRPAIITRGGRPVAAVVPIDSEALEDWILANAPEFVEGVEGPRQARRPDRATRHVSDRSPEGCPSESGRQTTHRSCSLASTSRR